MWVEQSYKHVKHELGWSQYQVRSDRAMRRHWQLVCCAFSFCWYHDAHPGHMQATNQHESSAEREQQGSTAQERPGISFVFCGTSYEINAMVASVARPEASF